MKGRTRKFDPSRVMNAGDQAGFSPSNREQRCQARVSLMKRTHVLRTLAEQTGLSRRRNTVSAAVRRLVTGHRLPTRP
jgi:hypothetical protein